MENILKKMSKSETAADITPFSSYQNHVNAWTFGLEAEKKLPKIGFVTTGCQITVLYEPPRMKVIQNCKTNHKKVKKVNISAL